MKVLPKSTSQSLKREPWTLQEMIHTLKSLVRACSGSRRPDCPILEELELDHGKRRRKSNGHQM